MRTLPCSGLRAAAGRASTCAGRRLDDQPRFSHSELAPTPSRRRGRMRGDLHLVRAREHERIPPRRRRDGAPRPDSRRHRSFQRRPRIRRRSTSGSASTRRRRARCRSSSACAAWTAASWTTPRRWNYLPIDGTAGLRHGRAGARVRRRLRRREGEVARVTVQALGGTGAPEDRGTDFLRRVNPGAGVWISDPSWENHRALFEGAGFTVNAYPVLRRGEPRPRLCGDGRGAREAAAPARSSCCMPAATTRPAST